MEPAAGALKAMEQERVGARQVRIPVTSTRKSAVRFAKILERVAPNAANGFQFEGQLVRPGGLIDESELPERAVLLEGAGSDGSGRKDSLYLYLLWRYDRGRGEWEELARVWAASWEWAYELGPIAERALHPVQLVPDVHAIASRLETLINDEMASLEPRKQAQLAGVLHDRFATRVVSDWLTAIA